MDNEPVTAKSLSWTYMIQGNTFARAYKDTLSDFPTWVKKENVDDGILIAKNLGPRLGIDESEFGHEVYTILHNKDAHGKKGAIVAIVKGTDPETACQSPEKDAAKGSGSGRAGLHGPERQHALYRENGLP